MLTRFGSWLFDSRTLLLRRNGQYVPLRPKAAVLLKVFVGQPNQVISKRHLANQVWGGRRVSEQSLFQAISELRSALEDEPMIITYPNQGYCFAPPPARETRPRWMQLAACALLCVGLAGDIARNTAPDQPKPEQRPFIAPAVQALATGIALLQSGQPTRASAYFKFALGEDPSLTAARALLAESLLAQGQVTEAGVLAQSLTEGQASESVAVSAMAVLSRVFEQTGQHDASIDWARSAHEAARQAPMACAALATRQRLDSLLEKPAMPPASPLQRSIAPETSLSLAAATDLCKPWLSTPRREDLGLCVPKRGPVHRDPLQFA